jgi:hypothetical protein
MILIFGIFILSFVSADFEKGNSSHLIITQYSPSERISGWINISLDKESADSLFIDSNDNQIKLLDIIKKNINFNYSCSSKNCTSEYTSQDSPEYSMNFTLSPGEEKLIGIKIGGNVTSIDSLKLIVNSNANASCYSQIGIDILNDGSIEYINQEKSLASTSCDVLLSKGCFEEGSSSEHQYSIAKSPKRHCQNITFYPSPAFKIGAWVNNPEEVYEKITVSVHLLNMTKISGAECDLPPINGYGTYSCDINYPITEKTQYFVCISSNTTESDMFLKGYGDEDSGCGFYYTGSGGAPSESVMAFYIFSQGLGFDPVEEINISASETVKNKIKKYIPNSYGSYNCGNENCIIPIAIKSQANQDIELKNLELKYTSSTFGTEIIKQMYSIQETPTKISAGFQKMSIDYGNFTAPEEIGKGLFELSLNGEEIFSEEVNVRDFPVINSLNPLTFPSIIPLYFTVSVTSSKNIVEYSWDFNDSTPIKKTTSNRTEHAFSKSKNYYITVKAEDSDGLVGLKTFSVLATIPKEEIGNELEKKRVLLNKTKKEISAFDLFPRTELTSILEIAVLEDKIKALQKEYSLSSNNENYDYTSLAANISMIKIPELIEITNRYLSLPLYSNLNQIDLEILKSVGGDIGYDEENKDEYIKAIPQWQVENIITTIDMEGYSGLIEGIEEHILSIFKINIENNYQEGPVYLFIKKMENLKFNGEEDNTKETSGDYYHWELNKGVNEIEFSTSERFTYETIPLFVSPELSVLAPSGPPEPTQNKILRRIGLILLALFILFLVALIIYTILSVWYKRKYENYLFKNRNDLYNLISYVHISNKSGEDEETARSNLKKYGWTGEQITYVIKKYSGKRTGMLELPLTKLIDKIIAYLETPKSSHPKKENHQINTKRRAIFK